MPRKMVRSALYTTKSTPLQAMMAMPWVRGLLMRGTLMAREIPDRARIPSVLFFDG